MSSGRQTALAIAIGIVAAIALLRRGNMEARTKKTIRIGLAGDTMLGRMISQTLTPERVPYADHDVYRELWGTVLPYLQENDLNLLNLETTFTRSTNAMPKVFNFKSDPDHAAALREAKIGVVNIANNHIGDFGNKGLIDTINTLDEAGIAHVGAGINKTEAQQPVVIEHSGIRIGIIGATDNEPDWRAGPGSPGTNYFSIDDMDNLLFEIQRLAQQVDVVIVSLQWGPNKRQRPTQEFVDAAHAMVDAGADIIHGHSAHIFQGIETYEGSLILYDTGNFVDDYAVSTLGLRPSTPTATPGWHQADAVYPDLRNDQSFLFVVHADSDGVKMLKLVPIRISNMQVNIAAPDEAREIVQRMQKLSAEFDTTVTPSDDGQRATVNVREE